MRKKVPTPQPRTTIVSGHEIVHFPFLEMLHDLLGSSKFTDMSSIRLSMPTLTLVDILSVND